MIKIKRFNEDILNETLQPRFCSWVFDSYISRLHKTATTCFQNMKVYLENDHNFDVNNVVSICCFECFKQFVCNFLHEDFML